MKKILLLSIFFCLSCTSCMVAETNFPTIEYSLDQDGRKWKMGYNAKNDQISIVEYVLENESIENWSELVTTQSSVNIKISLEEFFDAFIKQLKESVPGSKVNARIISRGPNNLFGEWWIHDDSKDDQHEWFQLFKEGDTIAILRYTTKNLNNLEGKRKVWEHILGTAKLQAPLPPHETFRN